MTEEFNWASNLNSATINIRKERQDKATENFALHLKQTLDDNPSLLDEVKEHAARRDGAIPTA
ncbi:hypothetical protein PHABIO_109 [Pseudomonas phage Phabio]|uniref:Uncharacterized protein n=1 Tax=Pseudomonas phage Phabio TaxID=2006668 RepID=A0A1Y0STU9_9CAUD|nr:hypothetical protein MZD05_gp109 [Pseudomonas phage Phabio]ARV76740.1 hypothetical protein PHABIO_109 [Pseudomonas phage Phabio]